MPPKDDRPDSGFIAFWTSLPGVLTGLTALIVAIGGLVALLDGDDDTHGSLSASGQTGTESASTRPSVIAAQPSLGDTALARALTRGIATAHASGGRMQAAVWVEGANRPITRGDSLDEPMRPWSMVRPAIMIAAYREAVAGGQTRPSATLTEAMRRTLVRAENCANFRVVLGLQTLTGGREQARMAVSRVFSDAKADHFEVTSLEDRMDCKTDAMAARGEVDPRSVAVQFGTSAWTITDAIAFAHALATGDFGDAGRFTLSLMREPKDENQDPNAARGYTAPLNWGAGKVLARWNPAYKGGWGGAANRTASYMAGQIAIVEVAGRSVAIALVFHPDIQPSIPCMKNGHPTSCATDDPGVANVVEPIEAVLGELAQQFAAAE